MNGRIHTKDNDGYGDHNHDREAQSVLLDAGDDSRPQLETFFLLAGLLRLLALLFVSLGTGVGEFAGLVGETEDTGFGRGEVPRGGGGKDSCVVYLDILLILLLLLIVRDSLSVSSRCGYLLFQGRRGVFVALQLHQGEDFLCVLMSDVVFRRQLLDHREVCAQHPVRQQIAEHHSVQSFSFPRCHS
jgi:hypothetical protein